MTARPVEWVLVVYYGLTAHQATYGRLSGSTTSSKDYIQLYRTDEFTATLNRMFAPGGDTRVPLNYKWPSGSAPGHLIFRSSDRPHLSWETHLHGAPQPWRMSPTPSEHTAETIPGDPSHTEVADARSEFTQLAARGAGQPYLLAVKLRGEDRVLHLRAYLGDPDLQFSWGSTDHLPAEIRGLTSSTSQQHNLAWGEFRSGGKLPSKAAMDALDAIGTAADPTAALLGLDPAIARELAAYLAEPGFGLFFDPTRNHDGWIEAVPPPPTTATVGDLLRERFQDDASAERLDVSAEEVNDFRKQIENENFQVADTYATTKTRGSAQRAFSEAVRSNYNNRCAITGIATREFLVAAHIVPWSADPSIRLDPSNGICLSSIMDRAFEGGYITIEDDLTIRVDWQRVGSDTSLGTHLAAHDGKKLRLPTKEPPKVEYLKRRRGLLS